MNKEDQTQGILVWLQPITVNPEDLEAYVLAHSSAREIRFGRWCFKRRDTKNWSTSILTHFRKKQKRSVLRAENYGDLITAEHKVLNEGRESRNNHRYAVVVLATHWNPCQTKTSQETDSNLRKFTETAAAAKRLFIRTIHYNLASIVKNYHGITAQLHFINQKHVE